MFVVAGYAAMVAMELVNGHGHGHGPSDVGSMANATVT
jgi:hypothetical protein